MAGVCEGECIGHSQGDEPLTSPRCHSYGLPQLYETCGWKSVCGRAFNLKGVKGKNYFSLFFPKLCFSFIHFISFHSSFHSMMRADPEGAGRGDM